jgi:hypothetical protein
MIVRNSIYSANAIEKFPPLLLLHNPFSQSNGICRETKSAPWSKSGTRMRRPLTLPLFSFAVKSTYSKDTCQRRLVQGRELAFTQAQSSFVHPCFKDSDSCCVYALAARVLPLSAAMRKFSPSLFCREVGNSIEFNSESKQLKLYAAAAAARRQSDWQIFARTFCKGFAHLRLLSFV